jgi:hypothetical protein
MKRKYDEETKRLRENVRVLGEEKRNTESSGNAKVEEFEFQNQRLAS